MEAIADPSSYDRARAAVGYDGISRALVYSLRYGGRLDLAPTMDQWMARAGREFLSDADARVPVSLYRIGGDNRCDASISRRLSPASSRD
jgi:predicted amidophosphoribosyltransferase